jgi:O-antigen ligase
VTRLAIALILACAAFVDLEVRIPLPFWDIDAPVADFAALWLLAGYALDRLRGRPRRAPLPPLGPALVFAAIAALSAALSDPAHTHGTPASSLYWLLRKPIFSFLAYGCAWPDALAGRPAEEVRRWLTVALSGIAGLSLATSVARIAAGDALWWAPVAGLTNNHKALATFLAPFTGWLLWRPTRASRVALGLALAAITLSLSKTAWLGTALYLAFALHVQDRPLVARRLVVGAAGVVAVLALLALPWLAGDARLQDAARSRRSLDLRAWEMVADRPILGQGPGASTGWEQTEFPHYRVNGVEAHGIVQKVAAETGLLGLAAWGAFTVALAHRFRARLAGESTRGERWAWAGAAAALHLQLLASTDGFTQGHWAPLGLAWWGVFRPSEPGDP